MHDVYSKFSWKIWLVIAIIFAVFVIFFAMFPLFSPGNERDNNKVTGPTPTKKDSSFNPFPTTVPLPNNYNDSNLEVTYPKDWVSRSGSDNQGSAVIIQPERASGYDEFPRVDILTFEKTTITPSELENQLIGYGFKKMPSTFQNQPMDAYIQTIDGKYFVTGNPGKKNVKKEVYIVSTDTKIYEVDFAYYQDTDEEKTKKELMTIIKTIQFK